jgi:two-component system, OmpR family, phosphate regulon response regulator PhoB
MPGRILIVEDDESLSLLLQYNLEAEGYKVDLAIRAEDADITLRGNPPDLLLLDWMLPGFSGLEFCRRLRLRSETKFLPIIIVTARGDENDRVRGLATGADDYIVKPFSLPELLVRVRALLRRTNPVLIDTIVRAADIELDRDQHRVTRGKQEIALGPTEYRLLDFFMQNPGRVFSREQILDRVWGPDVYCDERTVDVHIGRLRKAINLGTETDPIRTVRGFGYSFSEKPVLDHDESAS